MKTPRRRLEGFVQGYGELNSVLEGLVSVWQLPLSQ
jgi:hypothetical protein